MSEALVWWVIFTLLDLAITVGYLVYLVYFKKQTLGEAHINLDTTMEQSQSADRQAASAAFALDKVSKEQKLQENRPGLERAKSSEPMIPNLQNISPDRLARGDHQV